MNDTKPKPSPAAMRAAERIMAEWLADDPYDGGGYSPAHEKDIVLGIAAIIDAEFANVIATLKDCLPYVERAYDYSFPDYEKNDAIAQRVRDAIGPAQY